MSCRSEDLLKLCKRRRAEGYDLPREAAPDYYAWIDELQMYSSSSGSQSAGGTSAPDADVVASSCAVGDDVDPGGTSCTRSSPLALDSAAIVKSSSGRSGLAPPTTCADVKRLKMQGLRELCREFNIVWTGRVSKRDLFDLVCKHFALIPAGEGEEARVSGEKPSVPLEIEEAYKMLPSFPHITSGWSVSNLQKVPPISLAMIRDYLINSPDKAFDGESLRCYKQLRAYQHFSENHLHNVECNLWEQCKYFYFVRVKCLPSQDTVKQPYRCIVCINRESGTCYGAHCQCVSGIGEACSHVAALLFALEDFSSRGMQHLSGPAVTETICKWCKPASQKVELRPLSQIPVVKASNLPQGAKVMATHWHFQV